MKYLVSVLPYIHPNYSEHVSVSIYDPLNVPTTSGVFQFVLDADSLEEARLLGQRNWEGYERQSIELSEIHQKENIQLYHKYKILGYHQ